MKAATRRLQLVVCGIGGQGVVYLARVLAEAAIEEGREAIASETHGMAQRGGAVDSFIKIGDFAGPVVRPEHADAVLVLDRSRLAAGQRFLREGGPCFVNAPAAVDGARVCDALAIAREIGNPRGTNLVLLGFAAAERPDLFPDRVACLATLERLSPPPAKDANRAAFTRGWAQAEEAR